GGDDRAFLQRALAPWRSPTRTLGNPAMNFSHSLAVVTGGASGLGRAVAERVVAAGGKAVIIDLQEAAGHSVAKEIGASFIKCDVSVESQVIAAMTAAREAMSGINLLVNCAGVIGVGKLLGKEG